MREIGPIQLAQLEDLDGLEMEEIWRTAISRKPTGEPAFRLFGKRSLIPH
jgi:hypothetical protein